MKVKTPSLLKKIIAALSNKTNQVRIRLMIFFLLHKNIDKASLTHSLQALVSQPPSHHHVHHHHRKKHDVEGEETTNDGLLVHYNNNNTNVPESDDEGLCHAVFEGLEAEMVVAEEEEEEEEVVVAEKVEEEEDIDQAADMFIQRVKREMQLQKQLSLDRHQRFLLQSNA